MADATVIPFPVASARVREQDRLRRALEALQDAVADQKRVLSDWRFAMAELGVGVAGLGHSLMSYQDGLSEVDAQLSGLRAASATLSQTVHAMETGGSAARSRAELPD